MSAVAGATPNNNKAVSGSSSPNLAASPASPEMTSCVGMIANQNTALPSSMLAEKNGLTNGNQTSALAAATETTEGISAAAATTAVSNQGSSNNNVSEATSINNQKVGSSASDPPLPADLKKILSEVARNGSCSWLSWTVAHGKEKDGVASATAAASSSSTGAGDLAPVSSSSASATLSGIASGKIPASSSTTATTTNNPNNKTQKYALGLAIPSSNRSQSRRPYTTHSAAANRLGTSSPHFPSAAVGAGGVLPKPTRTKHRNGVKVVGGRRRLPEGGSKTQTGTTAGAAGSRKRPLFLIRTTAAGGTAGGVFSPGSVGSGRTSGSEPDDSTQYECDSEGTSATSCSELSTERRDHHLKNLQRVTMPASKKPPAAAEAEDVTSSQDYQCLKDVFRVAIGLVLDYWYRHRGGYKLSPAERRRSDTINAEKQSKSITKPASFMSTLNSTLANGERNSGHQEDSINVASTGNKSITSTAPAQSHAGQHQQLSGSSDSQTSKQQELDAKISYVSAEDIFRQRRHRLLMMLAQTDKRQRAPNSPAAKFQAEDDGGPPFTIQRIAEVLIAPERYYTQTHKLCNCLEKLLLVTSSTKAFGGSTGGVTSQSRLEERELAALADEKGRLESEFRQRALKRRHSSLSDDMPMDGAIDHHRGVGSPSRDDGHGHHVHSHGTSPEKNSDNDSSESSSREMLEAAARSLRTKFDHVGIDPHSSAVNNRDVRSIAENRGMTNSPPPPSLGMSGVAASNIALPGHAGVGNFVRQHLPEQNTENMPIARVPSPILFSQQGANDPSAMTPLHAAPNMHNMLHMHHPHAAPLGGVSMGSAHSTHTPFDVVTIEQRGSGASAPNAPGSNEGADLEGRSSASNSDVDSESDDVSFDDSASDRSDGSDSGHSYEPFTAARAMALNRIQQQQRLQSRGGVLTSLALHQSEGGSGGGVGSAGGLFRAPDSEYQSGDSIDSTRGEDSGGSDSSSSDLAD